MDLSQEPNIHMTWFHTSKRCSLHHRRGTRAARNKQQITAESKLTVFLSTSTEGRKETNSTVFIHNARRWLIYKYTAGCDKTSFAKRKLKWWLNTFELLCLPAACTPSDRTNGLQTMKFPGWIIVVRCEAAFDGWNSCGKKKGACPSFFGGATPMFPTMLWQNVAEEKMKSIINITIITKKVKTSYQHKREVKTENRSMGRRRRLWHSMFCIGGKVKQLKTKKQCNERRATLVVPAKKVPLSLLTRLLANSNTSAHKKKMCGQLRRWRKTSRASPFVTVSQPIWLFLFFLSLSLCAAINR